jgi:catechol 2,3-dioxygenase-like lactoylglutathione lyase family enzyme
VITRVRSVGIYVSDQQRALEFYRDVLGCDVLVDTPMGEGEDAPRWIEVRLPRDDVNLLLFTPEGQADRVGTFSNVIFHVDDIHETYEQLSAKGVRFPTPPEQAPWGKWWAVFADPDGNQFGLGLESED